MKLFHKYQILGLDETKPSSVLKFSTFHKSDEASGSSNKVKSPELEQKVSVDQYTDLILNGNTYLYSSESLQLSEYTPDSYEQNLQKRLK